MSLLCTLAALILLTTGPVTARGPGRAVPRPAAVAAAPPRTSPPVVNLDSGRIFTLTDLLTYVTLRHPVARQAGLLPERAQQEVRFARGLFDPSISSKYAGKAFAGKDYFHDWDSQVRVPIWYGLDVKAGFERGVGAYVNPENATPAAGLSYVGLSVPLGQGLLMDERRTAVRQAQALQGLAEAERRGALNKLLLQATKDYWDWSLSYERLQLLTDNAQLADVRFRAVRQRVRLGDLAAIDSVEALGELQSRQATLSQARMQFQNATLLLSTYLWNEQGQPVDLPASTRAQALPLPSEWRPLSPDSVAALTDLAQQIHPELLKSRAKLNQLSAEQRWLTNKLWPKLTVDYNLLQAGPPFNPESGTRLNGAYLQNNYKLGASLTYPLLLRQERAKRQLNRLKRREVELDLQQDAREIQVGVRVVANEREALREQLGFQEQAVGNAARLRTGEQTRFEGGESSVFLLNSREAALVSARLKLAELQAKYAQVQATLRWATGGSE